MQNMAVATQDFLSLLNSCSILENTRNKIRKW